MKPASAASALRVQEMLGPSYQVVEFEESTATSAEAAAAIGCTLAQIAKSLVFRAASGKSVLVVASGVNRVDEKKVATAIGEKMNEMTSPLYGADEYIDKPFEFAELEAKIAGVLEKRAAKAD